MHLQKILFESKQSIINLGFPEVAAAIFYEIFGNKAFLFAKWYKEYKVSTQNVIDKRGWWEYAHSFGSSSLRIKDYVDLYNAAKISKEEYNEIRKQNELRQISDFNQQQTLSLLKDQIKEKLLDSVFFSYNNFIEAILKKEITDLKPYENLTFQQASEKYEQKKIFEDKTPLKTYPDGWKWIDAGKKCHIIGDKMRNCGSTGVMGTDADRTMLTLFDPNNEPHVVATYSPNEKRISGVEGGASTQIKPEYIPYVLDLIKTLDVNLDVSHEKSKELKIRYLLGDKIKSLKAIYESLYNNVYKITTKLGKVFYTDSYQVISDEELKKIPFKQLGKKVRTIPEKVLSAFNMHIYRETDANIFRIEDLPENLNESYIFSLKKFLGI